MENELNQVLKDTVYRKESFPSKESHIKLLQSIYLGYEVGIITSYLNRIITKRLLQASQRILGSCMRLLEQCLRTTVQQVTPCLPATMSQP